jgi:hypothetical protein
VPRGPPTAQPPVEAAGAATQRPASSQTPGYAQSEITLQLSPQRPPLHAYGAQPSFAPLVSRVVWRSTQTAPAMQVFVGRSQPKPSAHSSSARQVVAHAPDLPSQRFGEQEGVPKAPRASGVHVPRTSEHVSQAPSHATLQQNESTQKPLAQSEGCAHTEPLFFLHAPSASHVLSPAHVSGSSAERTTSHAPAGPHRRHAPPHGSAQQTASRQ